MKRVNWNGITAIVLIIIIGIFDVYTSPTVVTIKQVPLPTAENENFFNQVTNCFLPTPADLG